MSLSRFLCIGFVAVCSACGGSGGPAARVADVRPYLLMLNELASPDFTATTAPHILTAAQLAGTPAAAAQLTEDGLSTAASEVLFRQGNPAFINGPFEVTSTVEEFRTPLGAQAGYAEEVAVLDSPKGAVEMSTGALGDEAHAVILVRTAVDDVQAVQFSVLWRNGLLLNTVVVRGRYGGTPLDDALLLAQRQEENEPSS